MESARYAELFLPPEARTPDSFWISLRYFNLYRIAVATLFLSLALVYDDTLNLGSQSLPLFRGVCVAYLVVAVFFHVILRNLRQHFVIARAAALGEVGLQQGPLQRVLALATFLGRPMQKPVRVESVVDTIATFLAKLKTHCGAALADRLAGLCLLLGRRAVLLREVFRDVLPGRRHRGVELERLEMQLGLHITLQSPEGALQRGQADRTPGAGHVGNEIDLQMLHARHCNGFQSPTLPVTGSTSPLQEPSSCTGATILCSWKP